MDNKISINKIIADIKATKGNRSGCQGLSSTLESDGYITSICKWGRATSPDRINALVEHVEKQDAALIAWEKTMMEVCGEDGPASVASEIRNLRALRDTALTALRAQVKQLAAENVALKAVFSQEEIPSEAVDAFMETAIMDHDWNETSEWSWVENETEVIHAVMGALKPETPATDAYLAGIKADAITASLDACSDYLETDCVMDRLDISYEDAEKRTSGAIEFHDAMVNFANQVREGAK